MTASEECHVDRIPLSRSQQNIYHGVLQDNDPTLYLIGKSYRFHQREVSGFLAALESTVLKNPVLLCVLEAPLTGDDHPDLVPRLEFGDIVRVQSDDEAVTARSGDELSRTWSSGILAKPLVRYTVRTDESGSMSGLDVHAHHILLDGGGIGIIEADLARHLAAGGATEIPCVSQVLTKLTEAHRVETTRVEESLPRLADVVQRELSDEAHARGRGQGVNDAPATEARGILHGSVMISGKAYDTIVALSEVKQVPLNVLVAAAAVAVHTSLRQSTECLLVDVVANRFADPDLNVATCLVNSVAYPVRFPPSASVQDVVRTLDRGYVKAARRRWLREEEYRRMYLAINSTLDIEGVLTLNFIREPCAPGLRPFLSEAPVVTDIGPVVDMTVACVVNEHQRTLNLNIWNRADLPENKKHPRVAERIAATLELMAARWDEPMAMTVGE